MIRQFSKYHGDLITVEEYDLCINIISEFSEEQFEMKLDEAKELYDILGRIISKGGQNV
jgi:hypothetical protein